MITVVDSLAALTAGAYALTENYLYTEEAMIDYLGHLTPGGVAAISRWYLEPPAGIARTVAIAKGALGRSGHERPERSIAVVRHGPLAILLVRNEPFTSVDIERLRAFADRYQFSIVLDPLAPSGPLAELSRDQVPPTDDKPFFFDTAPLSDILAGRESCPMGTRCCS